MSKSKQMNDWRFRCPNGHTGWEPRTDGTYFCKSCDRYSDADPYYDELVDMKQEPLRY